jgi:hypothetical protein
MRKNCGLNGPDFYTLIDFRKYSPRTNCGSLFFHIGCLAVRGGKSNYLHRHVKSWIEHKMAPGLLSGKDLVMSHISRLLPFATIRIIYPLYRYTSINIHKAGMNLGEKLLYQISIEWKKRETICHEYT